MAMAGFFSPASAKITRSCSGYYVVAELVKAGVPANGQVLATFGKFTGKGSCGNTVPNRCRERARESLVRCYRDHWGQRWDRKRPASCGQGVQGYGMADLKLAVEKSVCCSAYGKKNPDLVVGIYGITAGDKGCYGSYKRSIWKQHKGSKIPLSETYKLNCTALRKKIC